VESGDERVLGTNERVRHSNGTATVSSSPTSTMDCRTSGFLFKSKAWLLLPLPLRR